MNLNALNANEISRDCLIYLVHLGWLSKTRYGSFFILSDWPVAKKRRGSHPVITSTLLFIISYR